MLLNLMNKIIILLHLLVIFGTTDHFFFLKQAFPLVSVLNTRQVFLPLLGSPSQTHLTGIGPWFLSSPIFLCLVHGQGFNHQWYIGNSRLDISFVLWMHVSKRLLITALWDISEALWIQLFMCFWNPTYDLPTMNLVFFWCFLCHWVAGIHHVPSPLQDAWHMILPLPC